MARADQKLMAYLTPDTKRKLLVLASVDNLSLSAEVSYLIDQAYHASWGALPIIAAEERIAALKNAGTRTRTQDGRRV